MAFGRFVFAALVAAAAFQVSEVEVQVQASKAKRMPAVRPNTFRVRRVANLPPVVEAAPRSFHSNWELLPNDGICACCHCVFRV